MAAADETPSQLERDERLALGLVGGGVLATLLGLLAGSKTLRASGVLAGLGGAALLVRARLEQRKQQIEGAEESIRSELAALDPAARARVIADLAGSEPSSG